MISGPNQQNTRFFNDMGNVGIVLAEEFICPWASISSTNSTEEVEEIKQRAFDPGLIDGQRHLLIQL